MINLRLDIVDPTTDTTVSTFHMTPENQAILEEQFGFLPDARLPQEAEATNWNPLAYIEVLQSLIHLVNIRSISTDRKRPVTFKKRLTEVTPDERKKMVSHRDYTQDDEEWIEYQIGVSFVDPVLQGVERELTEFVSFLQSLKPEYILKNPSFVTPTPIILPPETVTTNLDEVAPPAGEQESGTPPPEPEVVPESVEEVAHVE